MPDPQTPPEPNITDDYPRERLESIGAEYPNLKKLNDVDRIDAQNRDEIFPPVDKIRMHVISMSNAIECSQNPIYALRTDLSEDQKKLVAMVAEERESEEGRKLTQDAADTGLMLGLHEPDGIRSGYFRPSNNVIILQPDPKDDPAHAAMHKLLLTHHEFIHDGQFLNHPMPQDLSSYDQRLWSAGMEGQASVGATDEYRRRTGLSPLTDEEKREIFSTAVDAEAYKDYNWDKQRRDNGRRLTVGEFSAAFGTVPGHEADGNFLDSGHFRDVADIFDNTVPVNATASAIPRDAGSIPYENLPRERPGTARIETKDGNYILYVSEQKGAANAEVEIYRRNNFFDPTYASISHRTITTDGAVNTGTVTLKDDDNPALRITAALNQYNGVVIHSNTDLATAPGIPAEPPRSDEPYFAAIPGNVRLTGLKDLPPRSPHTTRLYDKETHDVTDFTEDPHTHRIRVTGEYESREYINMAGYLKDENPNSGPGGDISRSDFKKVLLKNGRYAHVDKNGKIDSAELARPIREALPDNDLGVELQPEASVPPASAKHRHHRWLNWLHPPVSTEPKPAESTPAQGHGSTAKPAASSASEKSQPQASGPAGTSSPVPSF